MTSPDDAATAVRRAARQHLETTRLFGVDFVPVRMHAPAAEGVADAADAMPVPSDVRASIPSPASRPAPKSAPVPTRTPSTQVVPAPVGDKAAALAALLVEHDARCPHCTVVTGHTQTVFGEGDPDARLLFIGEAPGAEEDRTGRPFVGRAGQKLNEMIAAMGMEREQVYIANILKSRPPNNRTPLVPEVAACAPYLAEQVRIIRPTVIVTLGGPSTKFILQTDVGITRLRGQWAAYRTGDLEIPVMPTFHPAYLLRNYTRETRERMWSDLQAVRDRLATGT